MAAPIQLERLDVDAILRKAEEQKAERAAQMPTERDAIRVMFGAWQRLKELGWREGRYMPVNGERYAGIQCGSTGVHAMHAEPRGAFEKMYFTFDGELWPSSVPPVLFREWRPDDVQPQYRPTYLGLVAHGRDNE